VAELDEIALSLALSSASRAFSLSICKISLLSCYGFAGLRLHPLLVRDLPLLVLALAPLELDLSQLVVDNGSPIQQLLLFEKPSATEKTSSTPISGGTKARRSSTPTCWLRAMAPRKGRWTWLHDVKRVIRPPRIRVIQPWMSNNQILPTPSHRRSANNTPVLTGDGAWRWRRDDAESVDLAIRTARTDWRNAPATKAIASTVDKRLRLPSRRAAGTTLKGLSKGQKAATTATPKSHRPCACGPPARAPARRRCCRWRARG
jgi:hypothetical protein